ncbi:hypothetical protein B23_0457 [Geobacillus thermoleovorans B23]|nr:hypothetical protein B23_0457 [Geobacillus thermoleovorans B23]
MTGARMVIKQPRKNEFFPVFLFAKANPPNI